VLALFRATVRRAAFAPVYIIANTLLVAELRPTEASLLAIAQSWLEAINKSHGAGDLFRLSLPAKRDGADFNLVAIAADFSQRATKPFHQYSMQAPFDAGVARGGAHSG
jgi:hypothetical protein